MVNDTFKVGVVGTGWIAEKAAFTLAGLPGFSCYAIASRSQEKADAFARRWGVEKAYGSYSAMLEDPEVDLVYVGTPHSHHFDITREALEKGIPCLVEKAFMANRNQAAAIIELSGKKKVFLAEAIWTRYQPAVEMVRSIIRDGRIGEPRLITATLGYSMGNKERIMRADLCGGALLDLGVYALNFVRMFCDRPVVSIDSQCVKTPTGMDWSNAISIVLEGGILANVQSSACCVGDNIGVIAGTEGNIIIDNINNPQTITVNGPDRVFVERLTVPAQITGYEYQFVACRDAIAGGLLEPPQMPLEETLYIMELMDGLREKWGVRYPMDDIDAKSQLHHFS
ncbi:MAG: Gfo/Idh/MocA family oxidoreductase [Bacteroidales bacterium]|nr:Gfo/Idh/MocA family oxidoreductase [Bacteroidales bacterium]